MCGQRGEVRVDMTKYRCIVLDELFLLPLSGLHDIYDLLDICKGLGITFIATGDERQIKPVLGCEEVGIPPSQLAQTVCTPNVLPSSGVTCQQASGS